MNTSFDRSALRETILTVVEEQLKTGEPSETRQTLTRLLSAGYRRDQAVALIGSALLQEIWAILHEHRDFDREHFRTLLDQVG